jgi:hypothetical protein
VLRLLEKRGSPIKLWEPEALGLGKFWTAQGWVLWRWFIEAENSAAAEPEELDIRWSDLAVGEAESGSFTLAQAIALAATNLMRETR